MNKLLEFATMLRIAFDKRYAMKFDSSIPTQEEIEDEIGVVQEPTLLEA